MEEVRERGGKEGERWEGRTERKRVKLVWKCVPAVIPHLVCVEWLFQCCVLGEVTGRPGTLVIVCNGGVLTRLTLNIDTIPEREYTTVWLVV